MEIVDRVRGLLPTPARKGELVTLTSTDLDSTGSMTCPVGEWTVVGSYRIDEQIQQTFGYGTVGGRGKNLGVLYVKLQGGSPCVQQHGLIQVVLTNPNGLIKGYYLNEMPTERLDDTESLRGSAFIIPVSNLVGNTGDYIKILYKRRKMTSGGSPTTVSNEEVGGDTSTILMDTTLYV